MEQEEMKKEEGIGEEDVSLEELGIGEDKPQIEAKTVVIESYELIDVTFEDKKTAKKLVLKVRHPDMKELIDISGAKYQFRDKLKSTGLWLKKDNDGKIPYNSAVAILLRKLGKNTIKEIKGDQVDTVLDSAGYLLVKAY